MKHMPHTSLISGLNLGLEWDTRSKDRDLWVGSPRALRRRLGSHGRAKPPRATQLEASEMGSLRYRPLLGGPWIKFPVLSRTAGQECPRAPAPGPKRLRTCVTHRYAKNKPFSLTGIWRLKSGLDSWVRQAWTEPGQETGG